MKKLIFFISLLFIFSILSCDNSLSPADEKAFIENLEKSSNSAVKSLKVDGGLTSSDNFLQTQSNVLNKEVVKQKNTEITIIGSAIVAGLEKNVKLWESTDEVRKLLRFEKVYNNKMSDEERRILRGQWAKGISRARNWHN